MRKLIQFVVQLSLTAVFSGFIGAILGGVAGLVVMALGFAGSGDIHWFVIGGAALFGVCSLAVKGRTAVDEPDVDEEDPERDFEDPGDPLRPVDWSVKND